MSVSTQQQLFRLLLTKEMWEKASGFITDDFFPDELKALYRTLSQAHNDYPHNLSLTELKDLHFTKNPTLSSAKKMAVVQLLETLEKAEGYSPAIANTILTEACKQEQCRRILNATLDISEGRSNDWGTVIDLATQVFNVSTESTTSPDGVEIDDLLSAFDESVQGQRWAFNLPNLQMATDGLPRGSFGIIAARPEAGKTAFWVSLCMGAGGFVYQGANVHIWRNEEPARMVMRRLVSCFLSVPQDEVVLYQNEFRKKVSSVAGNITVLSDEATAGRDVLDLERYLRTRQPQVDVLVIDQLDNLLYRGEVATDNTEVLGKLYAYVRMLANKYGVAIIAITQAGSAADGKLYYGFNDLYSSRTNKPATADYIFCIGASKPTPGEQDDGVRALNFGKNKLKGPHKPILYMLDHKTSTIRV